MLKKINALKKAMLYSITTSPYYRNTALSKTGSTTGKGHYLSSEHNKVPSRRCRILLSCGP